LDVKMALPIASLTGLADRVQRAEERWRGSDAALVELERLAEDVDGQPYSSDIDQAGIFLVVTFDIVGHLAGMFAMHQEILREVREALGDEHPETQAARIGVFHAFRVLWAWKQALDAGIAAMHEAIETGDHPAAAAVRALTQTLHDLGPLMVAWLAKKAPDDGVKVDMLVALAARLTVGRAAGDTGLRLYGSPRRALLDEAAELDVGLKTVLRGQLPGAVLCAINEADDVPDLKTLRSRVMRIVAPRAATPPKRDDVQLPLMASPGDSSRARTSGARFAIPSAEATVLDDLVVHDLVAELQAVALALPPRQRQILALEIEWLLSIGVAPTATEIANVLGVAPSTVRVQLGRMRARVAALLKDRPSDIDSEA
jgi:DNA-directed RNA polymerase specialized sigma24 family protein